MTTNAFRQPDFPVAPCFIERWSPRAFTGEAISRETLASIFEAARWAPSSNNAQPWRLIYGLKGTPEFARLLGLLNESNQGWAHRASVLIVVLSAKTFTASGAALARPMRSHSFDAGAAWGYLVLQAHLAGWAAHGIGGFDVERAARELGVPDDFNVEIAIAIGKQGDKATLSEALQARETPNQRKPQAQWVFQGRFPAP